VNEWKLRTDPGYLRDRVFERDGGICARCGIDCGAELLKLKRSRAPKRLAAWSQWSLKPGQRSSLWDADHIVPVVEGGGECDLENIRTLCIRCHREVTAELRERRSPNADPMQKSPPRDGRSARNPARQHGDPIEPRRPE